MASFKSLADTYKDEESWLNINAFFKLNENWQAYAEFQPRFVDYSKYNGVTLHRGAIGRNMGGGFSAWAGYGLMAWNDRRDSKFPAKNQHEDRPFLQALHNHEQGQWKFTNRSRFEGRMFRYDNEISQRLRHLLRLQYKFNNSPWAIALWNEYFYNLNTITPRARSGAPVTKAGFDQHRIFLGGAYFFRNHMLESGYMLNHVHGANRDRNAHVWMTTLSLKF